MSRAGNGDVITMFGPGIHQSVRDTSPMINRHVSADLKSTRIESNFTQIQQLEASLAQIKSALTLGF
jgi:hypothetical protein